MKIGNSVRVKKGILSPDFEDLNIGGWEGRITKIIDNIVSIELDSITLSGLSNDFIIDSLVEDMDYFCICLEMNKLEIVQPRDSHNATLLKQRELNTRYSQEEEEKRIADILESDDCGVNERNLKKYFDYLKMKLQKPCILTGMEDFDWEEPYLLGGWSKKEYEKLKKTKASYTDEFEFVDFVNEISEWKGVFVKVKRISDDIIFDLPLWDLEVIDVKSPDFLLVSDYSSWMTNYQ